RPGRLGRRGGLGRGRRGRRFGRGRGDRRGRGGSRRLRRLGRRGGRFGGLGFGLGGGLAAARFLGRLGLGLAALAFAVGQGDGPATGLHLLGGQAAGGAILTRRGASRGGRRILTRTRDVEALRALMPGARADPALGFDDHSLGPPVTEALAHGVGRNRSRLPGLQAQRSARPRLRRRFPVLGLVVVRVAHSVASKGGGNPPSVRPNTKTGLDPATLSGSSAPPVEGILLVPLLSASRSQR